jgi:hypothetical protein
LDIGTQFDPLAASCWQRMVHVLRWGHQGLVSL